MSRTLDGYSDKPTASKKWDTELLALTGALIGVALGCAHEINEAISHNMSEVEPFAQILAEITAAALTSAALFAAASAICNQWRLASV
ncbi:hypothetical protein [Microvirga ossetica]|uniref:hypothetical protein n=1 Tax=Microvirga ossetica TaxID=1882682 RepID=UPI0012FFE3B2|nr:hypothetical protein [Microvirga ossetica]